MLDAIDKYLHYLKVERNFSEHTVISYRTDLFQFLKFCSCELSYGQEDVVLHQIDRFQIRNWLGNLSDKGLKRSTIARKTATLRSFFGYAAKRGFVDKNPARLLVMPKQDRPLPKTITPEGMNRMLDQVETETAGGIQTKAILELFYTTGIRLNELIQLNTADINLAQKQIIVLGKGSKQRIVPVGKKAIQSLKQHLNTRKELWGPRTNSDAQKALFIAAHGQRMYPRAIQRLVKKWLQKVSEVQPKSPHVLRHTFATHLLDKGADIRVIKELLGHTSLSSTQVYTHTSVERLHTVYETAHPRAKSNHN